MADKKISELVSASTPLSGTETIPIVQGGVTKKATPGNMTLGQSINPYAVTVSSSTPTITLNDTDAGHQTTFQEVGSNFELWSKNGVARIYVGGSKIEALQAQPDGDILCPSGNFVVGTAGKGIDFSADGNAAGMTSELLDDYEEGTWTPSVQGSTTAGTGVYGNQLGHYTKIGNLVHFQLWLQLTSHTGTGNIRITGLPFTSKNVFACGGGALGYAANLNFNANYTTQVQVEQNATYINLLQYLTGGGNGVTVIGIPVDGNMQVQIFGTYLV